MTLIRNIAFVHIPKAGGTSVRGFIAGHVDPLDIFPEGRLHHFPRFDSLAVERPMLFMSHLGFDFVRRAQADAFVLMRHPVERLLSLYSYAMHPGKNVPIIGKHVVEGMTLADFLTSDRPEITMNTDNAQVWQIASGYSDRHRKLRLGNGATMERITKQALKNLDDCAVLGVLEDIDAFYGRISAYFVEDKPREGPGQRNASEKRLRWADLTPAEKVLLESRVTEEWVLYERAKAG